MTTCRIGLGRADLTPRQPGPGTGWGPMGRRDCRPPVEPEQRLYATAIALEDEHGERTVLVNADLHCGGWHLWREAVDASGLAPSRVVLSGTHTHAGPGQRYGGLQYSLMAGPSPTDAWRSHRRLAPRIAEAVQDALRSLVPGQVRVVRGVEPHAGSNRAVPSWDHYDEATRRDFVTRGPGAAVPADAPLSDRLRDPRVTVLAAWSDDGSIRAALAWFAVHGTTLGAAYPSFGAGLWGYAAAEAAAAGWTVGFGGGSSGDVSPLPIGEDGRVRAATPERPAAQGLGLAETIGRRLGSTVVETLDGVEADGGRRTPCSLSAAHEVWRPRASGLPRPMVGMAQFGGGVDGPNDLWPAVADGIHSARYAAREPLAYPATSGQGPKVAVVQTVVPLPIRLALLFDAVAPKRLPLHTVRIDDHVLATIPGEASTMAGWRVEEEVLAAAGVSSASIVGFAGDYGGYWVTAEEYLEQRYEGAATIYGRDAAARLTERLAGLAGQL